MSFLVDRHLSRKRAIKMLTGLLGASPVAQRLKRLPGMRETGVWSLGWEDPLEKEMATHSSTLAWRIPWREEPGRLLVHGVAKSRTRLGDFTFTFHFLYILSYGHFNDNIIFSNLSISYIKPIHVFISINWINFLLFYYFSWWNTLDSNIFVHHELQMVYNFKNKGHLLFPWSKVTTF